MKAEFGVSIWKSTWNEILVEDLEYNNAQSSSPKMIFASMLYSLQKINFVPRQSAVNFRFTIKILSYNINIDKNFSNSFVNMKFKIGDIVVVDGLKSATELNGLTGRVVELKPNKKKNRLGIFFETLQVTKSIAKKNL